MPYAGLAGASRLMGRFVDTRRYYQEANALFEKIGDVYGRAYSYCGLGNAARMHQEYGEAMRLFAKAEKLYGRIGDKASFAYTVWAMATVHKCEVTTDAVRRVRPCTKTLSRDA